MRSFIISCVLFFAILFPEASSAQSSIVSEKIAPGTVEGYVFDYYGLAIAEAAVGIIEGPYTYSGPDGHYTLEGVVAGELEIGSWKSGYNVSWVTVLVLAGDTINLDFNLTQPEMVINPLILNATLNPEEYLTTTVNVLNTGTGPLNWQAEVNYSSMPSLPCTYSIALTFSSINAISFSSRPYFT